MNDEPVTAATDELPTSDEIAPEAAPVADDREGGTRGWNPPV